MIPSQVTVDSEVGCCLRDEQKQGYHSARSRVGIAHSVQRLATGWMVRGSNPSGGRDFPHQSRSALGPTQPPIKWSPDLFRGSSGRGVALKTHPPPSVEVKERVELYIQSPSGTSWPILTFLPFTVLDLTYDGMLVCFGWYRVTFWVSRAVWLRYFETPVTVYYSTRCTCPGSLKLSRIVQFIVIVVLRSKLQLSC